MNRLAHRTAPALAALLVLAACGPVGRRLPPPSVVVPALAAPAAPEEVAPVAAAREPAAPPRFLDLPPDHWAAPAVAALVGAGVLTGVAPGRFAPDRPVTRAEFAAMLAAAGHVPAGTPGPVFADVEPGAWYAPAVEAVAGKGWMQGVARARFDPGGPVGRAAAAVAAVRSLGLEHVAADEAGAPCPFVDCEALPAWARGSAVVAAHLGLLRGDVGGWLEPERPLTRAEAAVLLEGLRHVSPEAVAAEGGRVASEVHLDTGPGVAEVGRALVVHAYAHDPAGYVLPATFAWSVQGPGHLQGPATGPSATVVADGEGSIRVQAEVLGRPTVAAGTAVAAFRAASLAAEGLPPAGLAQAQFPVTVGVRAADGRPDPAAEGEVTLECTPAGGGAPVRVSARVRGGQATLPFPALPPGTYGLTFRYPDLPPLQVQYRAVPRPLGALAVGTDAATVAVGREIEVRAALPPSVGGPWPLEVTVTGTEPGPPPLPGEGPPEPVLTVAWTVGSLTGRGTAARLSAHAPGRGGVTVAVPGGALQPATLELEVAPTAAFGEAPGNAPVRAGQSATVSVALRGAPGGPVILEPVDPAGHPLPGVPAAVAGGRARASFTPQRAGTWRLRWLAPGAVPVEAGRLTVLPGPAARLVVDPVPSGVLLPGQSVRLLARVADAYGNPLPGEVRLQGSVTAGPGSLDLEGATFTAPAAVGGMPVATTLRLSSPDRPDLPPVTVTLRTVPSRAQRVAGKGLWLTFPDWKAQSDERIVAQALQAGATHLYLEVATSSDGFFGGRALDSLLPRAHAAGLAVVAWIYAALEDPAADTALLRQVAAYRTPAGDAPDGLALDLEERLDPGAVAAYLGAARAAVGPQGLVVAVTWAPQQRPDYPFAALAGTADVLAPMDYWHTFEADYDYAQVYRWVLDSVRLVRQAAGAPTLPVEVVAETFDWFSATGQGIFSPSAAELEAAVRAASDAGAEGISFYRPATATAEERAVLEATAWPPPG